MCVSSIISPDTDQVSAIQRDIMSPSGSFDKWCRIEPAGYVLHGLPGVSGAKQGVEIQPFPYGDYAFIHRLAHDRNDIQEAISRFNRRAGSPSRDPYHHQPQTVHDVPPCNSTPKILKPPAGHSGFSSLTNPGRSAPARFVWVNRRFIRQSGFPADHFRAYSGSSMTRRVSPMARSSASSQPAGRVRTARDETSKTTKPPPPTSPPAFSTSRSGEKTGSAYGGSANTKSNGPGKLPGFLSMRKTSPVIMAVRSSKPHNPMFSRITFSATRSFSMKTASFAPLANDSRPSNPEPAKRSRTAASSIRPATSWKRVSRVLAEVGLMEDGGCFRRRPLPWPPVSLTEAQPRHSGPLPWFEPKF